MIPVCLLAANVHFSPSTIKNYIYTASFNRRNYLNHLWIRLFFKAMQIHIFTLFYLSPYNKYNPIFRHFSLSIHFILLNLYKTYNMGILYNLKTEADPRLIVLVFRVDGKKFQYSTSQKIESKFWDKDKCRARQNRQNPGYKALNQLLNTLERTCQDAHRNFIADHYKETRPTWLDLKNYLKAALDASMMRNIETEDEKTFLGFVEQLIKERNESPEYSWQTIKNYRGCLNHLKTFEKVWGKKIVWNNIDLDFSISFRQYLYDKGKKTNTVHSLIKNLRVFLNEATERGINTHMAYKSKRFQVAKENVDNIYLTVEELVQLYHLDLPEHLTRIRDLFLVGCFTGLRYSDLSSIQPENITQIDGQKVIQITTQKTGKRVTIPVHPIVASILERHDGQPPKVISNQKTNKYLKECCQLAPWGSDEIMINENRSGIRYEIRRKKREMVSTHTARRSFATNAYKSGVPSITIMSITGHKTEKEFLKYIKVDGEEHAKIMAGHDFFRKSVFRVG